MMAYRLVTLDKAPGVNLVGIEDIIRRLLTKFILLVTGEKTMDDCGNINLWDRIGAVI